MHLEVLVIITYCKSVTFMVTTEACIGATLRDAILLKIENK